MIRHAVIGSRQYPDLDAVVKRVHELHGRTGPGWVLVSGGVGGVCQTAEATHSGLGGPVLSLRPVQLDPETFAVEEWRLIPGGSSRMILHSELTFANFGSAAAYRSMLIAERAEHGDAFWDGRSRGTSDEIDFFEAAGKSLRVVRS